MGKDHETMCCVCHRVRAVVDGEQVWLEKPLPEGKISHRYCPTCVEVEMERMMVEDSKRLYQLVKILSEMQDALTQFDQVFIQEQMEKVEKDGHMTVFSDIHAGQINDIYRSIL